MMRPQYLVGILFPVSEMKSAVGMTHFVIRGANPGLLNHRKQSAVGTTHIKRDNDAQLTIN